jgi:hypothetical protein
VIYIDTISLCAEKLRIWLKPKQVKVFLEVKRALEVRPLELWRQATF